jgi:hypothetical protein
VITNRTGILQLLESSLYVDGRLVIEDGSFTPDSGVVA